MARAREGGLPRTGGSTVLVTVSRSEGRLCGRVGARARLWVCVCVGVCCALSSAVSSVVAREKTVIEAVLYTSMTTNIPSETPDGRADASWGGPPPPAPGRVDRSEKRRAELIEARRLPPSAEEGAPSSASACLSCVSPIIAGGPKSIHCESVNHCFGFHVSSE